MLKMSIPNLLTLTNLSLGVLSTLETFNQNYFCAAILIIIAALIDRYDDKIARLLNTSSNLLNRFGFIWSCTSSFNIC